MKKVPLLSVILIGTLLIYSAAQAESLAKTYESFVDSVKPYLKIDCSKSVSQAQNLPGYIGYITKNFEYRPSQCAVFAQKDASRLDLATNAYVTFNCDRMYDESTMQGPLYLGVLANFAPQVDQADDCRLWLSGPKSADGSN
jgi:hypothetical protein